VPAESLLVPWDVADEVERSLAQAREAIVALDADAADRSLARAESALRRAPELPQSPWLMAEVQRGWPRASRAWSLATMPGRRARGKERRRSTVDASRVSATAPRRVRTVRLRHPPGQRKRALRDTRR